MKGQLGLSSNIRSEALKDKINGRKNDSLPSSSHTIPEIPRGIWLFRRLCICWEEVSVYINTLQGWIDLLPSLWNFLGFHHIHFDSGRTQAEGFPEASPWVIYAMNPPGFCFSSFQAYKVGVDEQPAFVRSWSACTSFIVISSIVVFACFALSAGDWRTVPLPGILERN